MAWETLRNFGGLHERNRIGVFGGDMDGMVGLDRWVGFVDRATHTTIVGWAFDRENPDASSAVEAVASNGRCAVGIASIFRQDVKDAGYGTGYSGFEIDIKDWRLSSGSIIVRFLSSGIPITPRPIEIDPISALVSGDFSLKYTSMMQLLAAKARLAHNAMIASRSMDR